MSLFKKSVPQPPEERWLRYQQEVENVAKMCGHSDIMSWPPLSTIRNHVKRLESELAALREENERLEKAKRADLLPFTNSYVLQIEAECDQLRADLDRAITLLRRAFSYVPKYLTNEASSNDDRHLKRFRDEIETFLKDHATKTEATNNG